MKSKIKKLDVLTGGVWEVDQSNRIEDMGKNSYIAVTRAEIDLEYPGYEDLITRIVRTHSPQISVSYKKIGKSSPAHLLAYSFGRKGKRNKKSTVEPICGTAADLHPEFTGIRTRTRSS